MVNINGDRVKSRRILIERENLSGVVYYAVGKYKNGDDFSTEELPRLQAVRDEVKRSASDLKRDTIKYYIRRANGREQEISMQMPAEESYKKPSLAKESYSGRWKLMRLYESVGEPNEYKMTTEERSAFLRAIREFNKYENTIYRSADITSVVNEIAQLVEQASSFTLKETEEWFDGVTANRHIKQMREALKVLQTEAKEIAQRQQRFEAAYEDIGQILGKYYEI